jgi:hypothetical protein
MSAADDLRDLRDALDCIAHGALPRWGMQTTIVGKQATSAAIEVYEKFVRAMFAESAAKVAIDAAQRAEDQHRTHAEVLTARCEAAEAERDALKARVASMMESMSMSCEEPPTNCECSGCSYAREKGGDV